MSTGKYSPTVHGWYNRNQQWHDQHRNSDDWYDRDGYDSYGYHRDTGRDRAGYTEWDYMDDGQWLDDQYVYPLHDEVSVEWWAKPFPWESR